MIDKSSVLVWGGVILAVVIGIGQESEQSWKLRPAGDSDAVRFTVHRFKPGNSWTWSDDVPLARFHNLSDDVLRHGGRANFEYVTDAGKLVCKGAFSFHSGAGTFTFLANPDFASELRNLGYGTPTYEQSFSMLMSNLSLEYARQVRDAGLRASTGQLLELRNHGVTSVYLRELKDARYDFTASDVVELRNHGVETDFLQALRRAGYDLTAGQIVELRNHGVDSRFVRDLHSLGVHPHSADMVQLHDHGVSAEYLADLKTAGYGDLTAEQAIGLRSHGVSAEFVQQARELGYKFSAQELTELHSHGVSGEYLKTLRESGLRDLSADQIRKLREHGVE